MIIFLIITLYILHVDAKAEKNQNDILFLEDGYTSATSILKIDDQSFWIAGKRSDFGIFLARVDQNGKILWKKTFGGYATWSKSLQIVSDFPVIAKTKLENLIVAMHTKIISKKETLKRARLIKLDSFGKYVYWDRLFGDRNVFTYVTDILPLADESFLTVLVTLENSNDELASKVVKFDSNGMQEWEQNFHSFSSKGLFLAKVFKDKSGFVAIGTIKAHPNKTIFFKLDKNGKIVSSKTLDIFLNADTKTIVQNKSGYAFISDLSDHGKVVQLDPDANLLWQKDLGLEDKEINAMIATKADGFAVIGRYYVCQERCNFLFLLDKQGNIIKEERFGGKLWDDASDIVETKEHFIIVGSNLSNLKKRRIAWMVKLKK